MTVKETILFLLMAIIVLVLGFTLYEDSKNKTDEKVKEFENKKQQILLIDSLATIKEMNQIKRLDSVYLILKNKDLMLEAKNKAQDERLRNIHISNSELPNF